MQIKDKVEFGTQEDVVNNLLHIRNLLIQLALNIEIRDKHDEKNLLLKKLTSYAAIQIDRLVSLIDFSAEIYAWITRNLFEVYLLIKYVSVSPQNLKAFLAQKATDEIAMLEGIAGLANQPDNAQVKILNERIRLLRNTLQKHDLPEAKRLAK